MTLQDAKRDYGATHYSVMADGATPQMLYKQETVKYNDGSVQLRWVYLSYANIWMGSDLNRLENKHLTANLKEI